MNAINEAIKNLETTSQVLERAANKPENYNTAFAQYLEIMGWEMHKHANELKQLQYMLGEVA